MGGDGGGTRTDGRHPIAVRTLVLAAGASTRFGGIPKALLRIGTETALERICRVARTVSTGPPRVVLGPHSAEIRAATALPLDWVENPDWEKGRTGSVLVGLNGVAPNESVLLWPVDHPFVEANTLRELVDASRGDRMATWVVPTSAGRGGHPILMSPDARPYVATLSPGDPLRRVLPRLGPSVLRLPVSDTSVRTDINTPEEYRSALSAWRERGGD